MGEVGGNTLGLYGCACSPDGDTVLAHGYQGAFHLWKRITNKEKVHFYEIYDYYISSCISFHSTFLV